jgi:hypothetical protein
VKVVLSIHKVFDLLIIVSITPDRDLHLNRSNLKGKMNIYDQLNFRSPRGQHGQASLNGDISNCLNQTKDQSNNPPFSRTSNKNDITD